MKKLLSIGLAAMLAFGLATTSFAAEAKQDFKLSDDEKKVTISKVYTLVNEGTESPAETFYLKQTAKTETKNNVTDIPDLVKLTGERETEYVAKAVFAKGGAGTTQTFEVTLPEYETVGIYKYTLQEVAGNTAGVTYRTDAITLVVNVINVEGGKIRVSGVHAEKADSDDKSSSFDDNKYSAGALDVTKTVAGNMGDKDKYFEFTVTLNAPDGADVKSVIGVNGADLSYVDAESGEKNPSDITIGQGTVFYLKHGETLTFTNVPYGVTYTVVENDANKDGYTTTVTGTASGKIEAPDTKVGYTNEKKGDVDTGVVLNNMPYILVLAVLAAGVAVFIIRKRRED